MKVAIYTLGCKVNQYETQAMEQTLRAKGHEVVDFAGEADAYVVNTCSVTAVSDQKSRQVIHRVQKQHPSAVVAVCGCYPQTHAEDVRKLGVDLIAGTGDREGFITLLEEAAAGKKNLEAIDISLAKGDRIRVTNGMFKGAEGYITRVHNAKRLIVAIEGIAAVATTYIPKDYGNWGTRFRDFNKLWDSKVYERPFFPFE